MGSHLQTRGKPVPVHGFPRVMAPILVRRQHRFSPHHLVHTLSLALSPLLPDAPLLCQIQITEAKRLASGAWAPEDRPLQDSGGFVIAFAKASSHCLHTSRHASTQPASRAAPTLNLPLTRVNAGHSVVAVLRHLAHSDEFLFFFTFVFSYSFRPGRTSRFCGCNNFPATSTPPHPHVHALPLDPDPATSTWPRHPSTPPTWLRPPPRPRHAAASSTRPPPPP
ncbi:hypothetical protein EDB84DRAFT_1468752 [Lactarius hengduanensis]|nr:hypothetical protein EDB84DRAFT_1468752 [Lactarius hengduanensis]